MKKHVRTGIVKTELDPETVPSTETAFSRQARTSEGFTPGLPPDYHFNRIALHQDSSQRGMHGLVGPTQTGTEGQVGLDTGTGSLVSRIAEKPCEESVIGLEGGPLNADLSTRISERRGSGEPLAGSTRQAMEQNFGMNFAHVRLHSDPASYSLNRSLGARAFTTGNDIFLGAGASVSDKPLLAHELSHVVQQSQMPQAGPFQVGAADSPAEQEAERVGSAVERSEPLSGAMGIEAPLTGASLQRQVAGESIPASFAPPPKTEDPSGQPAEASGSPPPATETASPQAAMHAVSEGVGSAADNRYQEDLDDTRLAGGSQAGWDKVALDLLAFDQAQLRVHTARLEDDEVDDLYEACQRAIPDKPQRLPVLERSYQQFLSGQAWNMAVRRLEAFPVGELPSHVSPAWVKSAEDLEALRQAAYGERFVQVRVAIMERQWKEATHASTPDGWLMLDILKGYNSDDLLAHFSRLMPVQKDAITEAAYQRSAKDDNMRSLLETLIALNPTSRTGRDSWPGGVDAWQGIDIYPHAMWMEGLPDAVNPPVGPDQGRLVDIYRLIPQLSQDERPRLMYYLAYNVVRKRTEYAIGPASLDDFMHNITLHKQFGEAYFGPNGLLLRGQVSASVHAWIQEEKEELHTVGGWVNLLQMVLSIAEIGRGVRGTSAPRAGGGPIIEGELIDPPARPVEQEEILVSAEPSASSEPRLLTQGTPASGEPESPLASEPSAPLQSGTYSKAGPVPPDSSPAAMPMTLAAGAEDIGGELVQSTNASFSPNIRPVASMSGGPPGSGDPPGSSGKLPATTRAIPVANNVSNGDGPQRPRERQSQSVSPPSLEAEGAGGDAPRQLIITEQLYVPHQPGDLMIPSIEYLDMARMGSFDVARYNFHWLDLSGAKLGEIAHKLRIGGLLNFRMVVNMDFLRNQETSLAVLRTALEDASYEPVNLTVVNAAGGGIPAVVGQARVRERISSLADPPMLLKAAPLSGVPPYEHLIIGSGEAGPLETVIDSFDAVKSLGSGHYDIVSIRDPITADRIDWGRLAKVIHPGTSVEINIRLNLAPSSSPELVQGYLVMIENGLRDVLQLEHVQVNFVPSGDTNRPGGVIRASGIAADPDN